METNQKPWGNHETNLKNHGNQPKTMRDQSNRPPLIQKRHVTNTGSQPTSIDPKMSRDQHGVPTDLLDV